MSKTTTKQQTTLEDQIRMTEGNTSNYPPISEGAKASAAPQEDQTKNLATERSVDDSPKGNSIENDIRAHSISYVLEMETLFKLYSYRCVDHKYFVEQVTTNAKKYTQLMDELQNAPF